jgi:DNA-binding NarL/FixJ family response regulator
MTGSGNAVPDRAARILVVDDEPLNVDYLEQELESYGYVVETASNGLEALDRVAGAPPDLILLDVMMPVLDGISTVRTLKDDPETRLIPVVLMTALNALEDRVRGIEAGADDFLSKPVDERELLARIRTALASKRAIDAKVGELRSTRAHLERYGRRQVEVAVLAVAWRLNERDLPDGAARFVWRRERDDAEARIESLGGLLCESEDGGAFVALFDSPDLRGRAVAAVEAGLAILTSIAEAQGSSGVGVAAAVTAGPALVASKRIDDPAGSGEWTYGAQGEPVSRATRLAAAARGGSLLAAGEVAAAVSHRFRLDEVGEAFELSDSGSTPHQDAADRRLVTVLVTDLAASTRRIERVGDRAGGELLAAHERETRAELALFGGEVIDAAGDGLLATFDSPARAIRCALAVIARLAPLGLTIRAGVHTGEIERVEGRARGLAIHVASRIAGRAAPGEVLVSATTRDVAAGAGLVFLDRGEHALKGVSEPRRLFAASAESRVSASEASRGEEPISPVTELTARELEVLVLVASGLSDAQVAQQLFLSVRTVNAHIRSVYRKTGVHTRAAARHFAEENGLV